MLGDPLLQDAERLPAIRLIVVDEVLCRLLERDPIHLRIDWDTPLDVALTHTQHSSGNPFARCAATLTNGAAVLVVLQPPGWQFLPLAVRSTNFALIQASHDSPPTSSGMLPGYSDQEHPTCVGHSPRSLGQSPFSSLDEPIEILTVDE